MTDKAVADMAEKILSDHRTRKRFSSLENERIGDLDFAYAVQDRLISLWKDEREGDVSGWKVGVTSARMQAMVGIGQPIAGAILSRHFHASNALLNSSDFVRLGIEAEIAVCIDREILETDVLESQNILERLSHVSTAFEIVEDRNADYKKLDAASLIVDNSWNKGIVLGPKMAVDGITSLIGRKGVLTANGEVLDQGMSEDVGGDPLRIVAWLAAHVARRGQPLRPGQWVLTGSIVTTKFPKKADHYHFAVEGLLPVEVRIA